VDSGPLGTIRNILLWSLLAGSAGTLLELLLIGHDEMATQFAPLVLLGIGILASAWTLIAPRPAAIRTLQILMVVSPAASSVSSCTTKGTRHSSWRCRRRALVCRSCRRR
jgi:hypothetical protein